jgi:hypothetical protein
VDDAVAELFDAVQRLHDEDATVVTGLLRAARGRAWGCAVRLADRRRPGCRAARGTTERHASALGEHGQRTRFLGTGALRDVAFGDVAFLASSHGDRAFGFQLRRFERFAQRAIGLGA